jgi:rhodanese-related sulfurtransferase
MSTPLKMITPTELAAKLKSDNKLFLMDVREPYEREICAIESHHIPMALVPEKINEIPTDQEVIIMCRSGKRAEAVANLLLCEYNFSNCSILEGGLLAWVEQIEPHLSLD